MFCHDFEKIAGDLAAGHLMEAGKRERALHHASECPACALRLKAERTLEAGLRALGEGADGREAPPHLKTSLRAAFDRQLKTQTVAPADSIAPIATVLTSAPARRRYSARQWVAAAAAVILIAAGVALMSRTAPPNQKDEISSAGTPARREQSPQPVNEPVDQGLKTETGVAARAGKKSSRRRAHGRAANSDDMALNNESVTDYIPLTYLADATAVESGTVLRVELPPSALITMGLPAPVERIDSLVKADLIIGDDGVARAVRFVGQDLVRR